MRFDDFLQRAARVQCLWHCFAAGVAVLCVSAGEDTSNVSCCCVLVWMLMVLTSRDVRVEFTGQPGWQARGVTCSQHRACPVPLPLELHKGTLTGSLLPPAE